MARKQSSHEPKPISSTEQARKTKTLPDDQRGLWYEGVDQVTALSVYGSAHIFDLSRDVRRFTLGSGADCDIAIPTEFLSSLHLVLERRGPKLRVIDQDTKNGTYFADKREQSFEARAGDTFIAGSIRFLLMNDDMRAAHPVLVELVGGDDEHSLHNEKFKSRPSDVLVAAMNNRNILITGEPGCDHVRLARTIHQASLLREREPVELAELPADRTRQRQILDAAARSSLILTLDEKSPILDAAFASMIFSSTFHVRVITCAPSIEIASHVLRESNVRDMGHVTLLPLARRTGTIGRLLDRFLAEKGAFRTTQMTPANQAGIEGYDWPGNFDELRSVAEWLSVLHRVGSLRKTAKELNVSPSTIHDWLSRVGLSWPLTAE
ncbi:MAG: FHA domain-containing protein [Kofleriaceae bacterium]